MAPARGAVQRTRAIGKEQFADALTEILHHQALNLDLVSTACGSGWVNDQYQT